MLFGFFKEVIMSTSNTSTFAFIPTRLAPYAFAFYMSGIMAFLMSVCLVAINTGFQGDFVFRVLKSYIVAFPVAFFCVVVVRPVVTKLIELTVKKAD